MVVVYDVEALKPSSAAGDIKAVLEVTGSAYDEMVGKGASSSGDNTMELSLGDQPLPEWLN